LQNCVEFLILHFYCALFSPMPPNATIQPLCSIRPLEAAVSAYLSGGARCPNLKLLTPMP
jgi:hypothetical protein